MLDIDGDDIARLSDADLRMLVARLSEAEAQRLGASAAGVTAGGAQDAPDGGLDVRVELGLNPAAGGFLPRGITGFQVKVPDMPAGEIFREVRPKGALRPVIRDLAVAGGAYIIVSSHGSTADRTLMARRKALRDAIAGHPQADALHTDFYDRTRIAGWVRTFPALVNWVRNRTGRPLTGWRHFENWSNPTEPNDAEFILASDVRLYDGSRASDEPLTILSGLARIRAALVAGEAVRLVGLSGLGKTRLVQALFDPRLGEVALDAHKVIYADVADDLVPSAREMARELVRREEPCYLVIDNCPPDTHRALVQICNGGGNQVGLLTVEYDVREDEAEGSSVYRLEPASDQVIETLLKRRAPQVEDLARRRIAEFSGGNARIALVLAQTVRRRETLSDLSDTGLFNRLFHQRNHQDEGLLEAAEACALVYSFDGETMEGDDQELGLLATLAGQPLERLYRHVVELQQRNLVQRRGKWRAVLPHALANRLARKALDDLLPATVNAFTTAAPERLLRSYTRRIGYLHDSTRAQRITAEFLAPEGLLGRPESLSTLGSSLFSNIAPVNPEQALAALERAVESQERDAILGAENPRRSHWAKLLRAIAYDTALFSRATAVLAEFVIAENPILRTNSAQEDFTSLFRLYLSGTHAPGELRLKVIREFVDSSEERLAELGLSALDEMLEARHFSSVPDLEFGSRPRDYGWHPKDREDVQAFFRQAIAYAATLVEGGGAHAARAKTVLAKQFRGLWIKGEMMDELAEAAARIRAAASWDEGWIAVRTVLRFDRIEHAEWHDRLQSLETLLSPKDFLARIRTYIQSEQNGGLNVVDGEDDEDESVSGFQRVQLSTIELGREIAGRPQDLAEILPEATTGQQGRKWEFGKGIARGSTSLPGTWATLVDAYAAQNAQSRNDALMTGFVSEAANLDLGTTDRLLDAAVSDPTLGPMFPRLQCAVGLRTRGGERIIASLSAGHAPTWTYRYLKLGRCTDALKSDVLAKIISLISSRPDGFSTAVEVLGMRYHSSLDETGAPLDKILIGSGRDLLDRATFTENEARA